MQTSYFYSSPSSIWLLWEILWGLGTLMVSKWKSQKDSQTKHIIFVGLNVRWTLKMHSHLDFRQPSSGQWFSDVVHRPPTIELPGETPKNANPWVLPNALVRISTDVTKAPAFSASILMRFRHTPKSKKHWPNDLILSCGSEYYLLTGTEEKAYLYSRTLLWVQDLIFLLGHLTGILN